MIKTKHLYAKKIYFQALLTAFLLSSCVEDPTSSSSKDNSKKAEKIVVTPLEKPQPTENDASAKLAKSGLSSMEKGSSGEPKGTLEETAIKGAIKNPISDQYEALSTKRKQDQIGITRDEAKSTEVANEIAKPSQSGRKLERSKNIGESKVVEPTVGPEDSYDESSKQLKNDASTIVKSVCSTVERLMLSFLKTTDMTSMPLIQTELTALLECFEKTPDIFKKEKAKWVSTIKTRLLGLTQKSDDGKQDDQGTDSSQIQQQKIIREIVKLLDGLDSTLDQLVDRAQSTEDPESCHKLVQLDDHVKSEGPEQEYANLVGIFTRAVSNIEPFQLLISYLASYLNMPRPVEAFENLKKDLSEKDLSAEDKQIAEFILTLAQHNSTLLTK